MQSFDRDPLILISDLARLIRTRADQRARVHGMTRAQWVILARLERRPGLSQSELAAQCEVEPITIVRLVDRLEGRGFVERRRDAVDRRINRLYLTSCGSEVLGEIQAYRRDENATLAAGLDGWTYEIVIEGLLRMKANVMSSDETSPALEPAE